MMKLCITVTSCVLCSVELSAFSPEELTLGWFCDDPNCREENDCDQSEGCQRCREKEEEIQRCNEEYQREIGEL